jgi:hypothetical protein
MGNTFTSYESQIFSSQTLGIMVSVEKGPPTDLAQNANTWGGIPDHFGCSYKWYDSWASLNIAGTTRTEVIWGDTCSMGGSSGMAIAFIEQGHYVTAFIVGATSSALLSADTTLPGILSGISFVTTKPADANTTGGGSGGGSSGAFDKDSFNTGGQPTIGAFTFSTSTPLKSSCYSSTRFEMKFIDSDTLEFQTFTGCSSGTTGGTGTVVIGYDFTISPETLTKTTYDLINNIMGSQTGYYATMTDKYITSSGVTYAGSDTVKHTAFYPESSSVLWWQSLLSDKDSVTSQGMVTTNTKFE